MHGDNELNARIDAALRSYADPGQIPDAHIALARITALGAEGRPRRRKLWAWLIPAMGAAALIALAAILLLRAPRIPQIAWVPAPPAVAHLPVPIQQTPERAVVNPASVRRTRRTAHRPPKLEMLPGSGPLSPEEQRLVAFANAVPPSAAKQMLEAQQHIDDPIQIAPIIIRPLDEDKPTDQPNRKDQQP